MTGPTVSPEDIQHKLEEISGAIQQNFKAPSAQDIRNVAIGAAIVICLIFMAGSRRGRAKGLAQARKMPPPTTR